MNLTRWEPTIPTLPTFRLFDEMTKDFNRAFGRFNKPNGEEALTAADWAPAVDIQETDKEYTVKAELPEVKKEDVKVTVEDGVLAISGERKTEKEEKGKKFHRTERFFGSFYRSFTVPTEVDDTKIDAEFKDGMLIVHMPKSEKAAPKAIAVKVA